MKTLFILSFALLSLSLPGNDAALRVYNGLRVVSHSDGDSVVAENIRYVLFLKYVDNLAIVACPVSDTAGVYSLYDKVEMAISFSQNIEKQIDNFLSGDNNGINPFDPDDIDIKADFFLFDGKKYRKSASVFGFYYEDFELDRSRNRYKKETSAFPFRLRFTPVQAGSYRCRIVAVVRGSDTIVVSGINFRVMPRKSTEKGFVKVAGKHFLGTGESMFFPVGHNMPFPRDPHINEWTNPHQCISPAGFENGLRVLDKTAETGQNFLRVLMTPWTFGIEFEKLNNYGDRMTNAWELDRFLDSAGLRDIRILLNMQIHYSLQNANSYAINQWDFPPYNSPLYKCGRDISDKGFCYGQISGVNGAEDFFKSTEAKRIYKKRLRYIIARWGYSTSIAVWELFSEINQSAKTYEIIRRNPDNKYAGCKAVETGKGFYEKDPALFGRWQEEMARYIKEELGDTNHLIGVSYSGRPLLKGGKGRTADSSFFSPYVDVISYNRYTLNIDKTALAAAVDYFTNINPRNYEQGSFAINKPMIFSEFGSAGSHSVDYCGRNIFFIKDLWFSAFSGLYGAGLRWQLQNNENNSWYYLGELNRFMHDVDFRAPGWHSQWQRRYDDKAEMVCMSNKNMHRAAGVLSNKTLNFFTMRQTDDCNCYRVVAGDSLKRFLTAEQMKAQSLNSKFGARMKIKRLGALRKYRILWFDVFNGDTLSPAVVRTGLSGTLKLKFPTMYCKADGGKDMPLLAFKIFPFEEDSFAALRSIYHVEKDTAVVFASPKKYQNNSGVEIILPENMLKVRLEIPEAGNFADLSYDGATEGIKSLIFISLKTGEPVYETAFSGKTYKLNLDELSRGKYLTVIESGKGKFFGVVEI